MNLDALNPASLAEREARRVTKAADAFQKLLARNEVKLMTSMVPATEPPELLQTLLKTVFDAGCSHGTGDVVGDMLEAMLKSDKFRDSRE